MTENHNDPHGYIKGTRIAIVLVLLVIVNAVIWTVIT